MPTSTGSQGADGTPSGFDGASGGEKVEVQRRRGRMTPGPKPRLSKSQILDEAVLLLADSGMEGLSLRRLAAVCGVTPMTLYGYFDSKDALLAGLVAHVMPAPPTEPSTDRAWSELLRECLVEIQGVFIAHPGVAAALTGRSLSDPAMDRLREYILELLSAAGLTGDQSVAVLGAIIRYILGCASVDSHSGHHGDTAESERLAALPATEFPELAAVAKVYGERGSRNAGQLGIDLLILGIAGYAVRGPTG